MQLKICLRMSADWANFRSLLPYNNMATIAALPYTHTRAFEDLGHFNILEQCTIPFLVTFLNGSHHTELSSQCLESLFFSSFGKRLIHVRPFVVFACSCSCKILGSIANAIQLLEPKFSMFLLIVCGLEEEFCNLLEALFLGLGSEICIFITGLRLSGESGFQIFPYCPVKKSAV